MVISINNTHILQYILEREAMPVWVQIHRWCLCKTQYLKVAYLFKLNELIEIIQENISKVIKLCLMPLRQLSFTK